MPKLSETFKPTIQPKRQDIRNAWERARRNRRKTSIINRVFFYYNYYVKRLAKIENGIVGIYAAYVERFKRDSLDKPHFAAMQPKILKNMLNDPELYPKLLTENNADLVWIAQKVELEADIPVLRQMTLTNWIKLKKMVDEAWKANKPDSIHDRDWVYLKYDRMTLNKWKHKKPADMDETDWEALYPPNFITKQWNKIRESSHSDKPWLDNLVQKTTDEHWYKKMSPVELLSPDELMLGYFNVEFGYQNWREGIQTAMMLYLASSNLSRLRGTYRNFRYQDKPFEGFHFLVSRELRAASKRRSNRIKGIRGAQWKLFGFFGKKRSNEDNPIAIINNSPNHNYGFYSDDPDLKNLVIIPANETYVRIPIIGRFLERRDEYRIAKKLFTHRRFHFALAGLIKNKRRKTPQLQER